jgi:hypothetical protein
MSLGLCGRPGWAPRLGTSSCLLGEEVRFEEPLSVPIALLAHHSGGGEFGWLAEQTYLQPFPASLRLRHSR